MPHQLTCAVCGSKKIIPNVRVNDYRQHRAGQLQLVVHGDPEAWLHKDSEFGTITAQVCGDCGHLELKVDNPRQLYDKYRKSKRR
ncbi:MAG: hypothetical protein MI861_19840 [Pirellulales bacterium]|nr:hypothetical protein [Pirellulales bacterium]